LAELVGDETFFAVASVVGGDHQSVRMMARISFSRITRSLLRAPTMDIHVITGAFQRGCGGIGHRGSNAAAHDDDSAESLDL
jgi:hypothetical protein